jgi:radical SAM-linked protein
MQANYVQRLRLTFSKFGPARFTGHLDLARTLERSFNRAQIPIAYSQGFNRRPRMSLASALPLGFTSEYELADIWLAEEMDEAILQTEIMRKMAPGIIVSHIESVPLTDPSLQSAVISASYLVSLQDTTNHVELQEGVERILGAKSLLQTRKRGKGKIKEYDLRPLIIELMVDERANDPVQIRMELCLSPSKSGRPDAVLSALSLDPYAALIHRTKITLSDLTAK